MFPRESFSGIIQRPVKMEAGLGLLLILLLGRERPRYLPEEDYGQHPDGQPRGYEDDPDCYHDFAPP